MRRISVVSLALLVVAAARAECLELKNGRASYGPLLGATRANAKFLPGDFLYFNFEIAKLVPKDKSGVVVYQQSMELINKETKKAIFKQDPPPNELPLMVGGTLYTYAQVVLAPEMAPGPYQLKISVTDRTAKPAATRDLAYDFEVLKPSFGIVAPSAPAVTFAGQDLMVGFGITGMERDKKTKLPDVDIVIKVVDESGKQAFVMPFTSNLKDLHSPDTVDITKMQVVPVMTPLAMARTGRFTIDVQATDKLSKEQRTLRLPVTVLDPDAYLGASK